MNEKKANIIEIFSSIQGEGPYIGYRQLFLRFAGCNLNCSYCDTSHKAEDYCKVEIIPNSEKFECFQNPIKKSDLIKIINSFDSIQHHSISLTGGEPLLHNNFLQRFLPEIAKQNKIYLETNGTLFNELNSVIDYIDYVSMDVKLESSTKEVTRWNDHLNFIDIAIKNNKKLYLKVVVTSKTSQNELVKLAELIHQTSNNIQVIIQPVDSKDKILLASAKNLFDYQEFLNSKNINARVIPQTHKFLSIL